MRARDHRRPATMRGQIAESSPPSAVAYTHMPPSTTEVPARDLTRRLPRERTTALAIVVTLVVWRSLPFSLFEQIQFDSDQAIFGLMAKHLSEGRAFPLFLYGRSYVLAVEAWLAAP